MVARASIIAFVLLLAASAAGKPAPASPPAPVPDPFQDLTSGVFPMPGGALTQYILASYVGDVVALKADPAAPGKVKVVPGHTNCLTKGTKPPEVSVAALQLATGSVTRERALGLNILSFLSSNLSDKDETKLTVAMTSHAQAANDADLDWACFDQAVADYFKKFPQESERTQLALVRVAAVWTITHETFRKVDRSADISGWGLVAKPKYLTQVTGSQTDYRVVVSLESDLESIEVAGFGDKGLVIAPKQDAVLAYTMDGTMHPVVYRPDRTATTGSRIATASWYESLFAWLGGGASVAKAPARVARSVGIQLAPGVVAVEGDGK